MNHAPNAWVIPGGHLELGETLEQGMCREVLEETGVKVEEDKLEMILTYENSN
jgi:8-oxo-dGTP diphosphatase